MTEKDIVCLFDRHHLREVDLECFMDCMLETEKESLECNEQHRLIKKRLAFVNHMLAILPRNEAVILKLHLIKKMPWNDIARLYECGEIQEAIGSDRRNMQRTKNRAINRIHGHVQKSFGASLDYLRYDN